MKKHPHMSGRKCVICGEEPPAKDAKGNEPYAYPKTEEEARIWQASMAAQNCCVESIQNQCCVCVEHIPDFVKRAKKIGKRLRNIEREKEQLRAEREEEAAGCQCPDDGEPGPERASVNVLLLNGASLPTYCGKGQSCVNLRPLPSEEGDSELRITKRLNNTDSDTEIFVQESEFKDTGGTFPDIDGTEVTVLRTPMQEEEQLQQLQEEAEQEQDPSVRRRRDSCLPGCTDVLLLGRGPHPTDECPCQCEQCSKPSGPPKEEPCCQPECCPETHQEYFTQPPCGCECEQQVRRELTKVIKTQGKRIRELEETLCRQNNLRNCLQRKLDELYCEFGRLDENQDENRSRLTCPGSERGAPDCAGVLHPVPRPPPPEAEEPLPPRRTRPNRRLTLLKANREMQLPEKKEEPKVQVQRDDGERVHWYAEKDMQSTDFTRRPMWIHVPDIEEVDSDTRIRFGKSNTYLVSDKKASQAHTPSTPGFSNSNSDYSISNRSRT
nr:uncharacterized protein LOC108063483 [Drosophila takahashii]